MIRGRVRDLPDLVIDPGVPAIDPVGFGVCDYHERGAQIAGQLFAPAALLAGQFAAAQVVDEARV